MYNDPNIQYIKKNSLDICNKLTQSYYDVSEYYFSISNYDKSLYYARFFDQHKIKNSFISFIIIYSIHIIYNKSISNTNSNLFKKHIDLANVFINFYKIKSLENYVKFINTID